jgi:RND family efflux transporter MFP subunit
VNRLRKIGWFSLILAACAAPIGCGHAPAGPTQNQIKEVEAAQACTDNVTDYDDFPGRTEAVKAVDVPQVTGYLDKINFEDGADVKKGDVLFEIDPRIYKAQLARALANVVQAEAHVHRLDSDYRRGLNLVPTKAMSQEEFDKVAGDRQEADAALGVARAERDVARQNLDFCKVIAPLSGRVSRRLMDPGNLVKANDTPLTTIVALDPMYVYFDVDERTVLRLTQEGKINRSTRQASMPVQIGLDNEEPSYPHEGAVDFVDNQVDPGTGTLRMRGVFDNADRYLAPGLFVRVRLPLGARHVAQLVAEKALVRDQDQKFLYVLTPSDKIDEQGRPLRTVEYRKIKVGRLHDGLREITEGLSESEWVVVSGQQRVSKEATVAYKRVEMRTLREGSDQPSSTGAGTPAKK